VPAFGRVAYLAASETDVALIKTKSGALKLKVTGEVLVRAPRAEVETVELKDGKKNAKQLVLALDGNVT
jgi:hypothetical protein